MSQRRSLVALLLVLALAVASPRPRAGARAQSAGAYDLVAATNVMVPTRDGMRLATDIYRPAQDGAAVDGKFPTILERTPYNKERDAALAELLRAARLCRRRAGRARPLRSEGHWRPIADDPNDGADTATWIGAAAVVERRHRHGRHVVRRRHPARAGDRQRAAEDDDPGRRDVELRPLRHAPQRRLRAALLQLGLHDGQRRRGESPNATAGGGARRVGVRRRRRAASTWAANVREYVRALPLRPGTTPLKFAPDYEAWLIEAMRHGDNDDFWKNTGSSVVDHLRRVQGRPGLPRHRLVRLVGHPGGEHELRRADARRRRACSG